MSKRGMVGALTGAALLAFAVASTAFAAADYSIVVTKTALPGTVPAAGGDVVFTVTVENTSTGDGGDTALQQVNLVDSLGGCVLSAPSGNGAPTTLAAGDTWTYTCTVTGVAPDTENTVNVYACHANGGSCNSDKNDASGTDSVTVTASEIPTGTGGGITQAPTDAVGATGSSSPSDGVWLLVIALGVLLGSVVVLTPSRGRRRS